MACLEDRLFRISIVGRIPATVVVSNAQQLCEDYIVESLRRGIDPRRPSLVASGFGGGE